MTTFKIDLSNNQKRKDFIELTNQLSSDTSVESTDTIQKNSLKISVTSILGLLSLNLNKPIIVTTNNKKDILLLSKLYEKGIK